MSRFTERTVVAVALGLVVVIAWFALTARVQVTTSLDGPADSEVWYLLSTNASTDKIIQEVKATGKHPDAITALGAPLLTWAVREERFDLVRWLLDHGANPNGTRPGNAPLLDAVGLENLQMVELLMERGADPFQGTGWRCPAKVAELRKLHEIRSAMGPEPRGAEADSGTQQEDGQRDRSN